MKKIIFLSALLAISLQTSANIRLPKILSDNMVLQRNKPITLWGWADANENITVTFKQQTKSTKADKSGKWTVTLSSETAGGPFNLTLKGKNSITLSNILIGEVWVCSGQSNMEWPLAQVTNATQELKDASFPEIRQFLVQKSVSLKPEVDVRGGDWKLCSSQAASNFTAVGYFFARELHKKLKVPIGLINTSWGGTHSETWTSKEAFEQSPEFKDMIAALPNLELDALAKQRAESVLIKLKSMNISLPASNVDQWKDLNYNDQAWNTMTLPSLWEQQQLEDIDGTIWFRKTILLTAADAGKEALLKLSMIDDSDQSYVNGVLVGSTNRYNEKRTYQVPANVLKEGRNIIAVRVEDTGGGGGIYGDATDLSLTTKGNASISLAGVWQYNMESLLANANSIGPNAYPTLLFNAMLNPLTPYAIQGTIWYQGESNAGRAHQYRTAFPLMIQDWRKHWKQGDFPFYFVQLANFNSANGTSEKGSTWAELREAQSMTLSLPNTGMAVITDIGEANDIHPRNKQDVGKRLAAIALANNYGEKIVSSGPVYQSMSVSGNKIKISFTQTGSGFWIKDKYGYLKGFEIAGADQKFQYAKAWVEGNDVIVSAEAVSSPVAVRYGWADNPEDINLYNKEGFPASPFRTDTWKGITTEAKFNFQ
jgi:sialate O-acetylesterase